MFDFPLDPLFTGEQPLRGLSSTRAVRAAVAMRRYSRHYGGGRGGAGLRVWRWLQRGGAGGRWGWKGRGASRTGGGSGGYKGERGWGERGRAEGTATAGACAEGGRAAAARNRLCPLPQPPGTRSGPAAGLPRGAAGEP